MNIVINNAIKPSEQKSTKARNNIIHNSNILHSGNSVHNSKSTFSKALGKANKSLDSNIAKLSNQINSNITNQKANELKQLSAEVNPLADHNLFFKSNISHSNLSTNAMKLLTNIGKSLELIASDIENLKAFNFDIDHTIENEGVSLLSDLSDAKTIIELLHSFIQDGDSIENTLDGKEINFDTLITLIESIINKLDKHIHQNGTEANAEKSLQSLLPEARNTHISPQDKIEQKVLKLYSRMLKEINSDLKSISEDIEAKNITIIENPSLSANASLINLNNISELKEMQDKLSNLADEVQAMPEGSFLVASDEAISPLSQGADLSQGGNGFAQGDSLMQASQHLRAIGSAKQGISTQSQFTLGSDNSFVKVETVRIDDVPRYVSRTVVAMDNNTSHTATLNLHPASLGKLNVEINIHNNLATLKFTAESAEAVKSIEGKVNLLKENLSKSGISVNAIEVESKPSSDDGHSNFSHNFQQNGGQHQDASSYQRTKKDYLNIMNFAKMRGSAEESAFSREAINAKLSSLQRYL